jgi:hypothetical protein
MKLIKILFKKLLWIILLTYCCPINKFYTDEKIFNDILQSTLPNFQNKKLFTQFNSYFSKMNRNFTDNKVIAIVSYNKNFIGRFFYEPSSVVVDENLLSINFQDNIEILYLKGQKFPYHKFTGIVLLSQKKMEFFTKIHGPMAQWLQLFIKENKQFFVYNIPFSGFILDAKMNKEVENFYKNILGSGSVHVTVEPLEIFIIKNSLKNPFLKVFNLELSNLEFYIDLYNKIQWTFTKSEFFSLRKSILDNYKKESSQFGSKVQNSKHTHHYVFNHNGEDIDNQDKLTMVNYYLSLDILLKIYEYIY